MKICNAVGKKNREEFGMFLFEEGEKIGNFGQNIYPCSFSYPKIADASVG